MKIGYLSLTVLALGLAASSAMAQTTPPVLILNIVDIQVTDDTVGGVKLLSGGAGYSGNAPAISFTGGGGVGAYATANLVGGGNAVGSVTVSADPFPPFYAIGGSGYVGPPTVTFVGGGLSGIGATPPTEATGQAYLNVAQDFPTPNQNEGYGPAGDTIGMLALASGTQPESGFVYAFTVNGLSIGETSQSATPGEPAGIYWTPPLPGIYSIVATTTDGNGNSATSPPIRYFA